jgi:hypothetical protein
MSTNTSTRRPMSNRSNIKEVFVSKAPLYAKPILPPRENTSIDSYQKQGITPSAQRAQKDFDVVNKKTSNDRVTPEKRGLSEKENDVPSYRPTSRRTSRQPFAELQTGTDGDVHAPRLTGIRTDMRKLRRFTPYDIYGVNLTSNEVVLFVDSGSWPVSQP